MRQETENMAKKAKRETTGSFALLQYEINRAKRHLEIHGESPLMRERLMRLEALLETCLAPRTED